MKKPVLILLSLLLILALIPAIGLPMWAAHEEKISEVPESGTYTCEELSTTLTFGKATVLTLPDGTTIEVVIDQGRRISNHSMEGWYEAHLKEGYVEITFEQLPIPFEPDHPYRFVETHD